MSGLKKMAIWYISKYAADASKSVVAALHLTY